MVPSLREQFGDIDIYLFDQLLRGRIAPGMTVLDAGCGGGRNLEFLMQSGYEVFGTDIDPGAVYATRRLAATLAPQLPPGNFRLEPLEGLSFAEGVFDAVIVSAVLHFARNESQFDAMLRGAWRVLKPGGLFFSRLASLTGMETQAERIDGGRRYLLPDGSERYLADDELLLRYTDELGGELVDPIKTTVVHNQRAMSTWVMRKGHTIKNSA